VNGNGERPTETSFLRDVLFIVFKRKIPLVAMFILGVLIVTYGITTSVPEYEATARVLVKRTRQGYEMPTETQAVLKRSEVVNTELQIIMSAAVAEAVVDKLGLAEHEDRGLAIARLENRIRGRSAPESDIIDITFRSTDPKMAARVVNAALDAYLEIRKGVELSTEALAFLETQVTRARAARDSVAAAMADLGASQGSHILGLKVQSQMNIEERFRSMLVDVEKEIDTRQRKVAAVEEWLAAGHPVGSAGAGAIYDSDGVRRAQNTLADLQVQLADAKARFTPDHPEVRRLERQIAATESVFVDEVRLALDSQRLRIEELGAEKQAIETMRGQLTAADRKIADTELQMKLLQNDWAIRADLYEVVMSRMSMFRITAATDPDLLNVAVVSRAAVPTRPTPRPVNMRVVVGMFLILFGVLLVFALEKMDQSLQSREDVQRHLGVKVLASIPDRRFHRQGR
jgi:succinoglycan biosynthesis transport protein ExoP